ncbi:sll0787 family AIR synthase-like protein [Vibrio mangrovi]|uniref:Sll0787 family AIR synthase-like protein n=1 Tax=Vibrio mangrovi TaxID=474394 RepID=A0A1Y6J0M9_9VIBR|nr:sll0787 family AIR synthase-like protein [Vibrio mangrovi]MDW6005160.1 sll0787 family AIR synthase-like protein [Vibrio mangrovi]SMS02630.1 thiamine monophosphate kinase [Vibrio mangrovi]
MLECLIKQVRQATGIEGKRQLSHVFDRFEPVNRWGYPNGDDTAVIPHGNGYDLLAIEGFIPEFVEHDPWFAGWCSVMVNLSDIAAMGGTPTAVVNAVWGKNSQDIQRLQHGILDAARAYEVDVVGGHTCHHTPYNQLSVAVLGRATTLMTSFDVQPGNALLAVVDLRGQYMAPFLNWNAATTAPKGQLRENLALFPQLARIDGVTGCKDISQAGLLGTVLMLMSCSGRGADIQLAEITRPRDVSLADWLLTFPSFGYLISCEHECIPEITALFQKRGISVSVIGTVNETAQVTVGYGTQHATFWDFEQETFWNFPPEKEYALCR